VGGGHGRGVSLGDCRMPRVGAVKKLATA
jgi:hypothetical protein